MARRKIYLPDVGEITLAKRRGNRNLRLSVTPTGQVRISMPSWSPYGAGLSFAENNRDWIVEQLQKNSSLVLDNGIPIGKSRRLFFVNNPRLIRIRSTITEHSITVAASSSHLDPAVQARARKTCEKALKLEAESVLLPRLSVLAQKHGYRYKSAVIKRMSSRWGSCSSGDNIALNSYLMQLPWRLIDYVLLHELVHLSHKHHQKDFWSELKLKMQDYERRRKDLKAWQPRLAASKIC